MLPWQLMDDQNLLRYVYQFEYISRDNNMQKNHTFVDIVCVTEDMITKHPGVD